MSAASNTVAVRRHCAWCHSFIGWERWPAHSAEPGEHTDGICRDCMASQLADATHDPDEAWLYAPQPSSVRHGVRVVLTCIGAFVAFGCAVRLMLSLYMGGMP